jgi:hypothetical protein
MEGETNLLSVSQTFILPETITKLSEQLGESYEKTKQVLTLVIPTLINALVEKGSTAEGAAEMIDLLNAKDFQSENDFHEKFNMTHFKSDTDLVRNFYGNRFSNVISRLGLSTGLGASGVIKAMGLAIPVYLEVLQAKVKNEQLSSLGLMNFLKQQQTTISGFVFPKDKTTINFSQDIPWKKIAFVALILTGLWFWYLGVKHKSTPPILTRAIPVHRAVIETPKIVVNEVSAYLSGGAGVKLPKRFLLSSLSFETPPSRATEELNSVSNALKEYPAAQIRLEAYAENSSTRRGEWVKSQLIERGIEPGRITVVGKEVGAHNKSRIDLVVTKVK